MSTPVYRILDANLNRAREALRVIEEYARFVLDDATLTEATKVLRHGLMQAARAFPAECLLAERDTPNDVGTTLRTDSEMSRNTSADVLAAATGRLTEALRAIEEYGKTVDPEAAGRFESLRYAAYDLEQRIRMRARPGRRFGDVRLYVLITESGCRVNWLETAAAALTGGADCLQLREKQLGDRELLDRAGQLAALCRRHDAPCIIDDRADIAVLAGADGVHLGQEDLSVSAARRIVGPDALIGLSTHTAEQARAAVMQGPDYIAVGPMFESPTKTPDVHAGPDTLRRVLAETSLPYVAIGGITADNLDQLTALGCAAVAVCHAVIASDDPESAARVIKDKLAESIHHETAS